MASRGNAVRAVHGLWGRRLRTARTTAGLSQVELARRLEISQSQLSEWEAGDRAPSDELKLRLADALGRHVTELYSWPEHLPTSAAA